MVQPKRKKSTQKKTVGFENKRKPEVLPLLPEDGQLPGLELFHEVEDYAIILLDKKGNVTSWNRGAEKIKGYVTKEILKKNYRIFYTAEDRKLNLPEGLLTEAMQVGRASYEGWRVRKDGHRFWGSMNLTALHDNHGDLTGFLKITRDLTDKKLSEDTHSNFVEELKLKNEALRESEERYHKMVSEVSDYAIILLDTHGKILDWNRGAERLKGYSAKEILGKSFRLFYTKEDKDNKLPEKLLDEAVRKGSVIHEGWRIKKSGERFWANVTITALHDDDDKLIGFSKLTRDLTDKKLVEDRFANLIEELRQANDSLRESEERYHRMISEVRDYAIILLDAKGNIENWNVGAQVIKGYSAGEIIGKNFKRFYSKEDQASGLPDKLLTEAKRVGRVAHEGWRVRKDGTRFWGSVVITALHGNNGNVVGFSKVTRDLTEKKLSDDTLRSTAGQLDLKNKALERVNGELSSFTNVASHDLKEPLRKIQIYAGRVKDANYDEAKSADFINKILDSAGRMQTLIEDLLSFSQVANVDVKKDQLNISSIIAAVKVDLEVQIAEKKAKITVGRLPVLNGVAHQMHQLFLNLISNAIKFSKSDTSPVIEITCKMISGPEIPGEVVNGNNQYYHISVRDNGIGFVNNEARRIFDPFFRLNPKGNYGGTGLGLSIVKKIVENHQGIVTAESQPGVGSEFHIYLPKEK